MLAKYLLSISLLSLLTCSALADDVSDDLAGFDDEEVLVEEDGDLAGFSDDSDDLSGFAEEETISQEALHVEKEKESIFTLSGDLAFKTSAGYKSHRVKAYKTDVKGIDYSGINQAQTSLYLQLDAKLSHDWKMRISGDAYYDGIYDLNSHNDYNHDTKDEYRTQLRFDDVYLQGRLTPDLDLKVGRQIVVWGKSDSIRITDVINPLDNRLPGMTDIEDLRLSVGMAKFDYYEGDWNYSFMLIAESRIMLEAPARSEFFPVDSVFPTAAPDPFLELKDTATSWENIQYAMAANGVFSGWDLSFYAADVLDQKWYLDIKTRDRRVSKVKMLGSAVNIAYGSWLLKSEVAFLNGVRYNSTQDDKNRLDTLVGVDYMGINDTVLSLEIANRHIFDYEAQMSSESITSPDYVDNNELQTAIRVTRSFVNETINVNALLSMFGGDWQYGGFGRIWVDIELSDGLNASFGVVDYIDGDRPYIKSISNNDRVFADITYSF